MPTQYLKFSGKCKWAKVRKPDDKYDNFSIQLYMDDKSWETFEVAGLSLIPKEDEDGQYVTFRRPNKKLIKNDVVEFGPPEVVGAEGLIGNGSEVTLDVVVYDTIKGKGHRLNRVTVNNLVKYEHPSEKNDVTIPPPESEIQIKTPEVKAPTRGKRPF
jgi:hypothetical protein